MSKIDKRMYDRKAEAMWDVMASSERTGIRFGMFPEKAMADAVKEGYDEKMLVASLMTVAERSGGMVS